jgi:hypothetical protein
MRNIVRAKIVLLLCNKATGKELTWGLYMAAVHDSPRLLQVQPADKQAGLLSAFTPNSIQVHAQQQMHAAVSCCVPWQGCASAL